MRSSFASLLSDTQRVTQYAGTVSHFQCRLRCHSGSARVGGCAGFDVASVIVAGCSTTSSGEASRSTTVPTGWPANAQSAIRVGCQHLGQLTDEVSEALDSSDASARLKVVNTGAAWKAVSGIGLAGTLVGLSSKYGHLVQDEAALDNGYAAAISGGPTTSLRDALSNLSADCGREGQTTHQ